MKILLSDTGILRGRIAFRDCGELANDGEAGEEGCQVSSGLTSGRVLAEGRLRAQRTPRIGSGDVLRAVAPQGMTAGVMIVEVRTFEALTVELWTFEAMIAAMWTFEALTVEGLVVRVD